LRIERRLENGDICFSAEEQGGKRMAEVTDLPGKGRESWDLPTRGLPAVETRDLPEPRSLAKYLGASVILTATAMGSGESIIWPYITSQVGMGLLWLAAVGITMQYFLNMEIERYTLATGETAVTGFSRFWKPWGVIFALGAILPNAWPGWAAGAGTAVTYIFGFGEGAVSWIAAAQLWAIALAVTAAPVVYQALEKIQMVLLGIVVVFVIFAIIVATDAGSWGRIVTKAPESFTNAPQWFAELGAATVLGAIAFAGAGGANNLVQSNYVRDKGMGMGLRIPNIVSPVTGEEVATPSIGYTFTLDEENQRRWEGWWRIANKEQLITFLGIGGALLIALSVLVNSTIGIRENVGTDLAFIQEEAAALGNIIAPWFETFFLVAVFIMLFSTNVGIVDYTSRLAADTLKTGYLARSEFWSESKIYLTVVWMMTIGGSIVLIAGLNAPIVLLVISAAGGGVVMALYSVMLIVLNTRALPDAIKLKGWRLPIMVVTAIFFLFFSGLLIWDIATSGV
jgi:hypothetical protein